jgi:NADH-quinone oxidoreductase subunit N
VIDKIHALWPEISLFAATCLIMILGVSRNVKVRNLCAPLAAASLALAGVLAITTTPAGAGALPHMAEYGKAIAAVVGLLLLLAMTGLPDREYEAAVARTGKFDPLRNTRGEFWSFFLFSITGLMLCAGSEDLILLFLALELTSLPTYIMVTMSTARNRSMEAGVKYFFLGALGAATFLYGFALLYGATGTTNFAKMHLILSEQVAAGGLSGIAIAGIVLSVLGICFKIAAVPMHFYTADVYQGGSASMSAFLAFVPKAAGFFALMLVLSAIGWTSASAGGAGHGQLPEPVHTILWVIAALTMTIGNVLAILQNSVKRILAYSSIAHSGYMLVGIIAGPGLDAASFSTNGLAAVLFYLLTYGVMGLGAFAVLASLERRAADGVADEIDSVDDLRGLCQTAPVLGWTMVLSSVGLLGLPPLLGFFGKLPLFTAGIAAGEYALVVILGVNSAIAAFYYLRLVWVCLLESPDLSKKASMTAAPFPLRNLAGTLSAVAVVGLGLSLFFWPLTQVALRAGEYRAPRATQPVSGAAEEQVPAKPVTVPEAEKVAAAKTPA